MALTTQTREAKQVVDEPAHLTGVVAHELQVLLRFGCELRRVLLQQDAREPIDRAQRCPQIVGDGIAESLELLVGSVSCGCAR